MRPVEQPRSPRARRGPEHGQDLLEIPGMICLLDLRTRTVRGERYLEEEALSFAKLHGSTGLYPSLNPKFQTITLNPESVISSLHLKPSFIAASPKS